MNRSNIIFLFAAIIFLSSCADVYYSPDSQARANRHQSVAVIPPTVSIAARKKVDAEALKEQQKTESLNFQKEMYSWLLRRNMQNKMSIKVQDVLTTNAKLEKAGYFDGTPMTPTEICNALGVDAVITSNYALTKPISEGAAIALAVFTDIWGSTNNATVTLGIFDQQTEKQIWNYNHTLSGSVGSTPASLVNNLMRNASRRMPYTKR